jgi:hypothetical protein
MKNRVKNFLDAFIDVSNSLPILIVLLLPFVDELAGYSYILCMTLASVFVLFSSKNFCELVFKLFKNEENKIMN